MAFLGQIPAAAKVEYANLEKQTIVGDNGVTYALDYRVPGPNNIEVFVNNVRQEPTTAYSTNGAEITFTSALAPTDTCYVVFQGLAVETDIIKPNGITDDMLVTSYAPQATTYTKTEVDTKVSSVSGKRYK